ncbi:hypothetical protein GUJ93_ZPchr0010g7485 [Zizania palustris]|uniref:Uncharacterized protein n=1 Tax=Zizania palustris TaxID=103762 RepID=A0A8J5WI54_ZIZPA|nr:hypothetical protein GUJ93_ZPchr0010g7485 [Zizania palustris]
MRSRKSSKKLRLLHPTERDHTTFRLKDDDDDTWLRLSGSPITSSLQPDADYVTVRGGCSCATGADPPRDAHAIDATDIDVLLAAAPPFRLWMWLSGACTTRRTRGTGRTRSSSSVGSRPS